MPAAELVADVAVDADWLEAHGFVEADARGVRKRDARAGLAEALYVEQLEERGVERAPDAPAVAVRVVVDGDVGRPLIRRPCAVGRGIRVAGDHAIGVANQPRVRAERGRDALTHFVDRRWLELERDDG